MSFFGKFSFKEAFRTKVIENPLTYTSNPLAWALVFVAAQLVMPFTILRASWDWVFRRQITPLPLPPPQKR